MSDPIRSDLISMISDQIGSDLIQIISEQIGSDPIPMVSDTIQSDLISVMSDRIGSDPIAMILGPIKSDPYNINDIGFDRIRSDIDDIGSDPIGCGSLSDHKDRIAILSSSPAASLDHDPGLAADKGLGDGVGGCLRPRRDFDLRGA